MSTMSQQPLLSACSQTRRRCLAFKSPRNALMSRRRLLTACAGPTIHESASSDQSPLQRIAGWSSVALAGQAALAAQAWAISAGAPSNSIGAPAAGTAAVGIEDVVVQNPLVTGLFGLAVLALVVVTSGAAYLAITGILDERREKSDRTNYTSKAASKAVKADQEKRRKSKKVPKSKSGRGFS